MLPDDQYCKVCSINDKQKCFIGHFEYSDWTDFTETEDQLCETYQTGSYFEIPLNNDHFYEIEKDNLEILKACKKFLNYMIGSHKIRFFWNTIEQPQEMVCPIKRCLTINYSLGYDTYNDNLKKGHKKPLILKMNETSEDMDWLTKYINVTAQQGHIIKDKFNEFESGVMRLNILPWIVRNKSDPKIYGEVIDKNSKHKVILVKLDTQPKAEWFPKGEWETNKKEEEFKVGWLDGCQVYINERNVNLKAIVNCLGGRTGEGVFGQDTYIGKPRFENHITKNTRQYNMPADKANIQPTLIGSKLLGLMKYLSTEHFIKRNPLNFEYKPIDPIPPRLPDPRPSIPLKIYEQVWVTAFGDKFYGSCFCCNAKLKANWDVTKLKSELGHIIPYCETQNNNIDNLVPVCQNCNRGMSKKHMRDWVKDKFSNNLTEYDRKISIYLQSLQDP